MKLRTENRDVLVHEVNHGLIPSPQPLARRTGEGESRNQYSPRPRSVGEGLGVRACHALPIAKSLQPIANSQ
ncbi:hypothetical protein JOD20_005357 [Herpetosiphon giganteus]|nr:hypothetical protein [Herpetosiphon giganteus]